MQEEKGENHRVKSLGIGIAINLSNNINSYPKNVIMKSTQNSNSVLFSLKNE